MDHGLSQAAAIVLRVLHLSVSFHLGIGDQDIRISLRILLDVLSGILGKLERRRHGIRDPLIVGELQFHLVHFFFHLAMLTIDLLVISDDLAQEIIDLFLAVAAQAFGESFIMNVHWCNHSFASLGNFLLLYLLCAV